MGKTRQVTGITGGVLCILSGAMHSIMGWPALNEAFAGTNAPVDLVKGLGVPWHFAGLAMVTFGVIAILSFLRAGRDGTTSLTPVRIIGSAYLLFGLTGFAIHKGDITFFLFLLPGALLLAGAFGNRVTGTPST